MWFAACLLFESVHSVKTDDEILWEERIVLIEASSETEALVKSKKIGEDEEFEYPVGSTSKNREKDKIKSTFRHIERIYAIDGETLVDGTELFSRILRDSEVHSILTPFE